MAGGVDGLFYACITHIPLPIAFPPFVTPVYVGDAQGAGRLNLRELAPDWVPHHPILGGTAGVFAVRNHVLRERRDATSIGVCQYRKFVSRHRISRVVARNYKAMDLVAPKDLPPDRFADAMRPGPEPFLVSSMLSMRKDGSYIGQYASSHHLQDFLRFTAEAVEQGVLDGRETTAFLHEDDFFPGGIELGVFPADFWLDAIGGVERVVRACVERYPSNRSGYQSRAWAFCGERLGSYLLLRRFRASKPARVDRLARLLPSHWSHRYVGRLNLIAEEGAKRYVVGG